MSTYAVGDIQGCLEPLQRLLDQVAFDPTYDRLWVAGDMVNRGPRSLATLRFLHGLGDCVTAVLGNHDLHFLAVAYGHKKKGSFDTLDALLQAPDRDELIHWLRHRHLLYTDAQLDYTMVHAGIPPIWTLGQAQALAREVEAVLQSDYIDAFLANMYGNKPNRWRNRLLGYERLRVITNYFTRMRFCTVEGELEFDNKAAPGRSHQRGFLPWFAHTDHQCRRERIVFGHWAALEGRADARNVTALDTGCVWGGCLTALRLEDGQLFRTQCSDEDV
ncbi:symmetrical bis(5'-nucleosyl)-tetraphosphatase [Gilvimarinus xylanilyticus]|uniref:Bis(5'-nucleosyl)-tetraphosphatase, symmetrical n=1 Tax=Gilvimarinus xylanilyticus TaxID=2944139 RepID=A0A9X2KWS3_9GAMM|nr:symmetrical bis(5'-nucleosyl)-tetraphosphatase [Gilvimarinus xylanilyticus]MCP8899385.1 symmetrical bis(5'-nucleosyl)-tetraphosphatase [Gilvimarinus xylanilyticus]